MTNLYATRIFFSLFLLSCCAFRVCGQNFTERPEFIKANSHWVFGSWWGVDDPNNGTGINFNPNPPVRLTQTGLTSAEGSCAMSDTATGDLLFYSNGENCWDRNYDIMPNGSDLAGSRSTNQGTTIVPIIDSPGKYYLFTLQAYSFGTTPPALYYSVVDMSLNGGLGDIVPGRKNILLDPGPLQESMVAVPGNNCDIWLIVHPYYVPELHAYHITREGIDPNPVVSNTGPGMAGTIAAYELGGMAISPDRTMIAVGSFSITCAVMGLISGLGGTLVAPFDATTGQASTGIYLNDSTMVYDPCFSPDNTKLYTYGMKSDAAGSNVGVIQLVQYEVSNLTLPAIMAGKRVITELPPLGDGLAGMRAYKDKIILNDMRYIASPNLSGTACNFQQGPFIVLDSIGSNINIGNDAIYPLPPDTQYRRALDTLVCAGAVLNLDAPSGFASYTWQDGSTGTTFTASDTGTYWVFSADRCHSYVDTFRLRLRAFVAIDLGADTVVCGPPPMLLKPATSPGASYLWPDGSTGRQLEADSTGTYWVTATAGGCSDTDTVSIRFIDLRQDLGPDTAFCKGTPVQLILHAAAATPALIRWSDGSTGSSLLVSDTGHYWVSVSEPPCSATDSISIGIQMCRCYCQAPSAFSPNGDGLNDAFRPVIEAGCPIRQYTLSIYNRFGQRVFSSADPAKGWDGTYNGTAADAGVYFYQVQFKGGTQEVDYYKKGDLTLLR